MAQNGGGNRRRTAPARALTDEPLPQTAQCSRLLIVDDHVIFRLGLRALLNQEPGLEVCADAGTADEALQRMTETAIDLVITDLALPGRSGLNLLADLRQRFPQVKSLVLTGLGGDSCVRSSLAAGATGYALKNSSHAELLAAIRSVCAGKRFLCEAVSSRIVTDFLDNAHLPLRSVRTYLITPRERDILTRVASGQQNRKIALDLGVSVWTVRRYRQNLRKKFALSNAAAITAFAIGHGLVTADSVG
jgi:DNA-binding NarL/FixJ family response regulator